MGRPMSQRPKLPPNALRVVICFQPRERSNSSVDAAFRGPLCLGIWGSSEEARITPGWRGPEPPRASCKGSRPGPRRKPWRQIWTCLLTTNADERETSRCPSVIGSDTGRRGRGRRRDPRVRTSNLRVTQRNFKSSFQEPRPLPATFTRRSRRIPRQQFLSRPWKQRMAGNWHHVQSEKLVVPRKSSECKASPRSSVRESDRRQAVSR